MSEKLSILLVDDDDVAAEAVIRSLRKANLELDIVVAENGQQALDIISNNSEKTIGAPYIVLLDLNMPVMNGFEFLEHTRNDPNLKELIIFILTTSDDDRDRSKAYYQNVAGYMVKSCVGPQFSKLIKLLDAYACAVRMQPQR